MLENIQTPCFVLDAGKLRNNIHSFKEALDSRFVSNVLGYSVKTNSLPALLGIMKEEGCYAEVVSYNEYNLAINLGFHANHIIYNGPMKDKATFLHAIANGAFVNIDTKREVEWLKDLPADGSYGVGLRVNLNLMEISPEDCKDGEMYSRFGFSIENGEFLNAVDEIGKFKNVKLVGLHLHRTSKTRSLQVYDNICKKALKIIETYQLHLSYLDLGGGFYGDMPGKPTYKNYVDTIADVLSTSLDLNKLKILVEPGNAIVASPFSYYTSIVDSKIIGGQRILVTDGTRNDVDPFFHKSDYFKTFFRQSHDEETVPNQVFVGCTCLENDILFQEEDAPRYDTGDMVKFAFVGAYTMCLSPLFIRYFPRVYVEDGESLKLVRNEWTEREYLN